MYKRAKNIIENDHQKIEAFRYAQSLFFAADSELASVGRFARKFVSKKVRRMEEKRAETRRILALAKQALWSSPSRYLDIGDGTILDCKAQLIGLKDANCLGKKNWPDAMSAVSDILGESIKKSGGKVRYLARGIAGTVQGDIHDIGIKLVTTFLTANGFDITFLGVDTLSSGFVEKAKELKPDLILLSALLVTTMPRQKEVIDSLKEAGIRENVKVMIGGAVITQEWADQIGADGYGADAAAAVAVAKKLTGV